jgi:hypothetical protein
MQDAHEPGEQDGVDVMGPEALDPPELGLE